MNIGRKLVAFAVVAGMAGAFVPGASHAANRLTLEASGMVAFGGFSYKDYEVTIEPSYANPRIAGEFSFMNLGNTPLAVGLEYASSANDYDGATDTLDGNLSVDRSEFALFLRFGSRDGSNIRFGYRQFKYDISDGQVTETENGTVVSEYKDAKATGEMTTGIDLEGTLAGGTRFTYGLTVGGTYFKDAEYDWSYVVVRGNPGQPAGKATLDAIALKLRPEISYEVIPNLRAFLNYQLSVSNYLGTRPEGMKSYVGTDITTGLGLGVRYAFSL